MLGLFSFAMQLTADTAGAYTICARSPVPRRQSRSRVNPRSKREPVGLNR